MTRQLQYQFIFDNGAYDFVTEKDFKSVIAKFQKKWPDIEPKVIILMKTDEFEVER